MGLEIKTSEAEHMEDLKNFYSLGEDDFDKIGNISASLLILANLNHLVNLRPDLLQKIAQILVKFLEFSRNA
jgi:hypothetical protein